MSGYSHAQTHSSIHLGLILSGSVEMCRSIVAKFVNCRSTFVNGLVVERQEEAQAEEYVTKVL
jgi:hypothetical protein